jgi:hypothetical protein
LVKRVFKNRRKEREEKGTSSIGFLDVYLSLSSDSVRTKYLFEIKHIGVLE